ncbi:ABC transporter ATP-binding protein [Paenibacillus sp. HN-1]|uniref:ABC transporter ATP-binding protein n=1 Tax=Paenibacillus TaxID=44249 RepID=UPI001CAA1709|nr:MULTISPECIES: ABC transporter ATP-binding protein [Paenibacillus]MBY9079640.1 ABC transporter ATP-binding protein [Paenibacillus sp. CGMCC 1.18879]MBY9084329.1 ABC transporter ATP-binding protein [Paenibacillus sinensis]
MELKLDKLSKQFADKTAVRDVTVSLGSGVYGLLGANGAGKTTLMRMICGVLSPTSGQILFDGIDIEEMGESYRALLGYLPQNFGYYPDFTAEEFLWYVASLKGLSLRTGKARSRELLGLVALADVSRRKIRTFSGGMKQRLGIAQAMLNDPGVVVLDEPTAGLDPKERVRFRNLISDLARNKIVLLSTHIVSDVEYIADQIFVMRKGSMLMNGTPQQLTASMESSVWTCRIPAGEANEWSDRYCISNLKHEGDEVELRIVSKERPTSGAAPVPATLEDLYLFYFRDEASSSERSGGIA